MKSILSAAVLAASVVASACTSTVMQIETAPLQSNESEIGPASASAQGLMILQAIPVGQNERFERAYDKALELSGGSRLVRIRISESWWSALLVSGYRYKVEGTAVRRR